jgi:hypothetical protein
MKEYQHHVKKDVNSKIPESFCGENITAEFHFLNIDHLYFTRICDGRQKSCEKCLKIIIEGLNK